MTDWRSEMLGTRGAGFRPTNPAVIPGVGNRVRQQGGIGDRRMPGCRTASTPPIDTLEGQRGDMRKPRMSAKLLSLPSTAPADAQQP